MVLSAVSDDQMSAVAEAVEGAVEAPKTRGFHAVDISFRDAEGNEIEPLKPIRVSMTSDAIKRAVEDESTAPVVVHVSDFDVDKTASDENMGEGESAGAANAENADEVEGDQPRAGHSERIDEQPSDNAPEPPAAAVIETDTGTEKDRTDTLMFNAESFSVYAIVYTVDFHYEINGKMYDFSIPGGGFVSLEHLVEVLGIASADENSTAYEEAVKLNEVEVSEAAKKFVADVESVEFSNPELMWVGKVDETTTVGEIKENKRIRSRIQRGADGRGD